MKTLGWRAHHTGEVLNMYRGKITEIKVQSRSKFCSCCSQITPATFRKILLVSIKFLSAILGPEMAAPILWVSGKNCVLSAGKPMSIKFLVLVGGGGILGFGGGGKCRFYFYGHEDFLQHNNYVTFSLYRAIGRGGFGSQTADDPPPRQPPELP